MYQLGGQVGIAILSDNKDGFFGRIVSEVVGSKVFFSHSFVILDRAFICTICP